MIWYNEIFAASFHLPTSPNNEAYLIASSGTAANSILGN